MQMHLAWRTLQAVQMQGAVYMRQALQMLLKVVMEGST